MFSKVQNKVFKFLEFSFALLKKIFYTFLHIFIFYLILKYLSENKNEPTEPKLDLSIKNQ